MHELGRTPREWAPYLERRADKHRAIIMDSAALVGRYLRDVDLLDRRGDAVVPANIGAAPGRSGPEPREWVRLVGTTAQLRAAVDAAKPGDVIQLLPGQYRIDDRPIVAQRPGTAEAPITVRTALVGDATIASGHTEAFKVTAPWWVFENLSVLGRCGADDSCEHAFHVVGGGANVVIRNNQMEDFNAHIKVNGEEGVFPDAGRVQGNTLLNNHPRRTRRPVTPIDLVAASDWRISGNLIADFVRAPDYPGGATYGAFVKGAGENNIIERNVVLCEWRLRPRSGQRIGLSLGGGGTFPAAVTRDNGRSGFEQNGGIIRDNLVAFCSDVGIYVNKGARSTILHNTLLDTAGIAIRFVESSADVVANLVDGAISAREGAALRARQNDAAPLLGLFIGRHPQRDYFADPARLALGWRNAPVVLEQASGAAELDLCGSRRPARPRPGAFESFSACR